MPRRSRACSSLLLLLLAGLGAARGAAAQDMEPRRWTHLPVDTNVLGAAYVYSSGDLEFDPVLRIEDATFTMHTAVVAYTRYFALFETTARVDVQLPLQSGCWEGRVDDDPRSVSRDGLGDPRLRFSLLLAGAPALRGEEFMLYRQEHATNTILGAGLAVQLPLGDYMSDKLINLGDNRFVIEPQLGVLHTRGPWSFELTGTMYLYTDNDDFFGSTRREQDPVFALQAHVVRTFDRGFWVSAGVAYGWGGESSIDDVAKDDARSNLLYGASFGFPLAANQGMRIGYIRRDALEDVGADSDNFLVSWSIRF